MMVLAEQLAVDDIVILQAGSRAKTPEHSDFYYVLEVRDHCERQVCITLADMWSNSVAQLITYRYDIVEVTCVLA